MKKTRLLTILLMAMAVSLGCTSCEKEDDNGIEVNLRNANNGGGHVVVLGNVWLTISGSNNFVVDDGATIASVGHVSGLSRVTNIPNSGWSNQVHVKEGNGYVIRNEAEDHYARVYVADITIGASSGGIIGATIRYEPDWK